MFRFTVRDAVWLVIVAALSVGWWLDSKNRDEQMADERNTSGLLRADISKLEKEIEGLQKTIVEMKAGRQR